MKTLFGALTNFVAGIGLALFLPVRRHHLHLDPAGVVPLIVLSAAVVLGMTHPRPDPPSRLLPYGLGQFLAMHLYIVAVGFAVERRAGSPFGRGGLVVPFIAALPIVWVAYAIWSSADRKAGLGGFWPVDAVFVLWVFFLAVRSLRVGFGLGLARAKLLAAPFVAAGMGLFWLLPFWGFWYQDRSAQSAQSAETNQRWVNSEATYYAQPRLLDEALSQLAPQRPGVVDLYFVGFGSYAIQDVFMKEVRATRELFERRFDAAGRTLVMINNTETVDDLPIASVSNLRSTLEDLGRIMDPNEDLLFLFLTTHGSSDFRLSVNMPYLGLNDLDRHGLAEILADSGIQNRVIVVSACYSGGFIETLSTPHSLVMTAARADRTSFGCSNTRDWTYFGQAYFDEALESQSSFVDAFYTARDTVARLETEQSVTPSEPQISQGAAIGPLLEAFEARLPTAPHSKSTAQLNE